MLGQWLPRLPMLGKMPPNVTCDITPSREPLGKTFVKTPVISPLKLSQREELAKKQCKQTTVDVFNVGAKQVGAPRTISKFFAERPCYIPCSPLERPGHPLDLSQACESCTPTSVCSPSWAPTASANITSPSSEDLIESPTSNDSPDDPIQSFSTSMGETPCARDDCERERPVSRSRSPRRHVLNSSHSETVDACMLSNSLLSDPGSRQELESQSLNCESECIFEQRERHIMRRMLYLENRNSRGLPSLNKPVLAMAIKP